MNVRLERNWVRLGYDVTFFEREPLRIMRLGELGHTWEPHEDGNEFVPTLSLPPDALEALLATGFSR